MEVSRITSQPSHEAGDVLRSDKPPDSVPVYQEFIRYLVGPTLKNTRVTKEFNKLEISMIDEIIENE